MPSKLRGTVSAAPGTPAPRNGTALFLIYNAARARPGLIHGKLDGAIGEHCAIGCYFADHPKTALPSALIDEVAMVNDSMPTSTPRQRKLAVLKWLRWKLKTLNFPIR